MVRRRVYVAGAFSADNTIDTFRNMGRGMIVGARLFFKGYAPFVPWLDYHFLLQFPNATACAQDFYTYSMAWLDVSEAMLVISGYENSKGTLAEIERAEERGIPIFYDEKELDKWTEI